MAFNITDEEVSEAVVSESDEQAHICLYRCKGELRTIETEFTIFSSNSIKVQLEQKLGGTVLYTQGFQFHKGTIRTFIQDAIAHHVLQVSIPLRYD